MVGMHIIHGILPIVAYKDGGKYIAGITDTVSIGFGTFKERFAEPNYKKMDISELSRNLFF
jgi:hypothetical protein